MQKRPGRFAPAGQFSGLSLFYRSMGRQMGGDRLQYTVDIAEHFVVPEAQHPKALTCDKVRARFVAVLLQGVLAAINLDYEPETKTQEIRKERTNRTLATELRLREDPPQFAPEELLGVGRMRRSERARSTVPGGAFS